MKHLAFLLFTLPLFAGDSLVLTPGDSLAYTAPASAPWTAMGSRRLECAVDVTDWATGATASDLWNFGDDLQITGADDGTGFLCAANNGAANTSQNSCINVSDRTVILFRAMLDQGDDTVAGGVGTFGHLWFEIWDADGTNHAIDDGGASNSDGPGEYEDVSGTNGIGGAATTAKILWCKQYSTIFEPGPSSPLPDPHGTGDLGDWTFDGNSLADSSPHGMNLSGSGYTFETTPTINPAPDLTIAEPNIAEAPTVRAGEEVTLTGSCSSFADNAGCSCAWSDQSGGTGPDSILFTGSTTACTTTAVFPTFGSYTLRMAATDDDANVGTRDFEVGAVAQDSTQHIVYPTDEIALIVGPQRPFGNSQWPWFEDRRLRLGNYMGAQIQGTSGWEIAGAGTVSVTNGSATVTGSGTDFQNDYCSGGSSNTSSRGMLIVDDDGLLWVLPVSTCNSATQITATANWNRASDSGLAYRKNVSYGEWSGQSDAQNFYDNGLAYGAMYFATGHTKWLDRFNTLESRFWSFPEINRGRCRLGPTAGSQCATTATGMQSLTGLMLWGLVNGTEATIFEGLEDLIDYDYVQWGDGAAPSTDIRPSGYQLGEHALAYYLDPDAPTTLNTQPEIDALLPGSPTRRDVWDAELDYSLGHMFNADHQHPEGAFEHSSANSINGAGTVNVTNGSPTVTCATTCNFQDDSISTTLTAAITSTTSTSAIEVVSTGAFASSGQIKIDDEIINYTGKTSTTFTGLTRGYAYTNTGATHSNGATVMQVTHEGRYFWAYSNSSVDKFSTANGRRDAYVIASVDSPTQLTLAGNYTGPTASGLSWLSAYDNIRIMQPFLQAMPMQAFAWLHETGYLDGRQRIVDALNFNRVRSYRPHTGGFYTMIDDAGCQAAQDADVSNNRFHCQFTADASTTAFGSSRYLLQEPMRASAYAAKYARDLNDPNAEALAEFLDVMLGHAFGKWGGPEADWHPLACPSCYAQELDENEATFTTPPKNKNWGFGFGYGGGYVWDALRDGDPEAEDLVSFAVPLDIASVSMATKASVTLYEPKGTVSRVVDDQTGSEALVTGDGRQGSHLAKIEYKNAMDAVLETDYALVSSDGEPEPVEPAVLMNGSLAMSGAASF